MAETSRMTPLGSPMPAFRLTDVVSGEQRGPDDAPDAKAHLVMFICNHCPYVIHVRPALVPFANDLVSRGVAVWAINSNSLRTHPQDGPENMKQLATEEGWRFPFLFDETQQVAKAFGAACTPDFFLYDSERKLFYRGRFDATRPGGPAPTGDELGAAVEAVLEGRDAPAEQKASIGCGIKWDPA